MIQDETLFLRDKVACNLKCTGMIDDATKLESISMDPSYLKLHASCMYHGCLEHRNTHLRGINDPLFSTAYSLRWRYLPSLKSISQRNSGSELGGSFYV